MTHRMKVLNREHSPSPCPTEATAHMAATSRDKNQFITPPVASCLRLALGASFIAFGALPQSWAQVRPDAGQTLRDLERLAPPLGKPETPGSSSPGLSITPTLPQSPPADERKITVRTFEITGVSSLDREQMLPLLNEFKDRELTLAELQQAAARITEFYREHGYRVARAYLPQQSIRSGIIQIAVLEGELGSVKLKNATRISDERILAMASAVKPGEKVYVPAVERGLLLLKDLPGVANVNATLQPGEKVGQTDLVVNVDPTPLVSYALDADNAGNRFTGAYRGGGTLKLNSPLGLGDQMIARMQATNEKLYAGSLTYRVPVMADGLVVGAAWSNSHYQLGKDFAALDANGTAMSTSLFATYPFIRSETVNIFGALSAEQRSLRDNIDAVAVSSSKSMRNLAASLSANGQVGPGIYAANVAYSAGNLNIKTPDAKTADDLTVKTSGTFNKLTYALSTIQPVTGPWSIAASANGQIASKNLDSSEKFSVGGADGVRAYPQGEAPSDEGYLLTTELRYALSGVPRGTLQLLGFVDHASVSLNKNPFIPTDNRRRLSAAGVGLSWQAPGDFLVRFSLGWKVGNAPATSDRDASVRGWIQGVKYFNSF
jgi:hemolysin activation/secretion protein